MSLRKAINLKCKDCTYDNKAPGTWRQQVAFCCVKTCPLWAVRPKTCRPIPKSIKAHYGADLDEYQPIESASEH